MTLFVEAQCIVTFAFQISGRVRVSRPTPFRSPVQRVKPASASRVKQPSIDRVISTNDFSDSISTENLLQELLNNDKNKNEMRKERPKTRPTAISTDRFRPANRPQALQPRPAPVPQSRPPPGGFS
jgi:hypothetical protein